MKKGALFIVLMTSCAFFFPQELEFSRKFQTFKKNVPVAIVNSEGCFYVLRYNKDVHDFTVEKRAKPSAEILGFTPLKMDSVNASWFNYEKLDYLFFEHHKKLFFVFEKVVNTRRTIYLKVIDSLSKSSGFIELASLEWEKTLQDIAFTVKLTAGKNILIVAAQAFFNGTVKKTAQLYDPNLRKLLWTKKLPLENSYTGYSSTFECNSAGDLFYVLTKSRAVGFRRKYIQHAQANVPVFFHDSVILVSYPNRAEPFITKLPLLANISNLNSISLLPGKDSITALAHIALQPPDSSEARVYFFCRKLSADLQQEYVTSTTPLDSALAKLLTFYDGEDYDSPATKEYLLLDCFSAKGQCYQLAQRQEGNYYKELLVWRTDLTTGRVTAQCIVPCKISGSGFSRFRNAGNVMFSMSGSKLEVVVPEATGNYRRAEAGFNYHRMKRVTRLSAANAVLYSIGEKEPEKKLLYRNLDFDLVPLLYQGNGQSDMLFYFNNVRVEKFAILKRNPS